MPRNQTIATFLFALAGFLILSGGGLFLLVQPRLRPGHEPPVQAATPIPAPVESAPPPAAAEFPLLPSVQSIARPDSPNRIVIPSISLDAKVVDVGIIVEDGKPVWETAAFAVGYHRGTALPGTRGNTVMAGHISSPVSKRGEVFRRLPEVRIGDRVEVYAGERRVSYSVAEIKVVSPAAIEVMRPSDDARLTLITCWPDRDYSRRLVVIGTLLEGPA
jgi:sortase A